ncbi:MAG: hypothetical protein CSA84_05815 [Actinomycetales bacterium]|nr:MAG: hypothetical protein CSA84_05815 [Actinomycetales bacterium]
MEPYTFRTESLDLSLDLTTRLGTPEAQGDLTVSLNNAADVARADNDDDQAMAPAGEAIELARLVLARE